MSINNTDDGSKKVINDVEINNSNNNNGSPKPKKKRGALHLIRVAVYMLRNKSRKPKPALPVDVASEGPWKKVLGSMRPLHLQSNESPRAPNDVVVVDTDMILKNSNNNEQVEELFTPPLSPQVSGDCASSSAPSSEDGGSRYASAVNLQALDTSQDGGEEHDNAGDHMIDAKAEEFIAQFYQQVKLDKHVE